MSTPSIIAVTVLLCSLALIWVMARARTFGPLVLIGVVLGASAGVTATALVGGMT